MTKEKRFSRRSALIGAIIVIVYLICQCCLGIISGRDFECSITNSSLEYVTSTDQVEVTSETPDIVSVQNYEIRDGILYVTLLPGEHGDGVITATIKETGEEYGQSYVKVSITGAITDTSTDDFTNYRTSLLLMLLLITAITVLVISNFVASYQVLRYSYQSVFCAGFSIWLVVVDLTLIYGFAARLHMIAIYTILKSAALLFVTVTFPAAVIFAILLTISNISLIKHEGFNFRNAQGIILSGCIVVGAVALFVANSLYTGGSETNTRIFNAVISIFFCAYSLLECFLIGAVICGSLSARHMPKFDKDFIVILGCKIRPDGTLYPLIRGRVDRGIEFYRKQLAATGKAATFIPSGGQGRDETVSESEAMRRYLIEQGIDPANILIEDKSRNTRENMINSMALAEEKVQGAKSMFVTTNFHVFRSGIISRQVGFEADGAGSKTKWYFWPNAYIREVIGMMSYKWKTLVLLFIPIVAFFMAIQFV